MGSMEGGTGRVERLEMRFRELRFPRQKRMSRPGNSHTATKYIQRELMELDDSIRQ